MGLGLNKFRLDEEIRSLASAGGSGLPSGPAGGSLSGVYPNPNLATGAATGAVLGPDVLTTSTSFSGAVVGLWNNLAIANGAVTTSSMAAGAATGGALGPDVAQLVAGVVPVGNLGSGVPNTTTFLRGDGTWVVPTGAAPTGAAGGSLTGTYPNPGLAAGVATGAVLGTDVVVTSQANSANGYAKPDGTNLLLAGMLGTGSPTSSVVLLGNRTWASVTATQADSTIEKTANKNQNSGYAGLDANGHIGVSRIVPSVTNGQVLTTVAGATAWAAAPGGGGGSNAPWQFAPDFQAPQSGDYAQMRCSVATSVTAFGAQRTGGTGANMDVLKNGVSILTTPLSLTATTFTAASLTANPTTFAIGDIIKIVVSAQTGSPSDIMTSADGSRVTF